MMMMMHTTSEEAVVDNLGGAAVKRKRTKRRGPRHHQPAAASSSSESTTTTEEEDMAHCLILLAGGGADSKPPPQEQQVVVKRSERYTSRKYTEEEADGVKAGFYVYECKTCNKCFPTFQALGGHRASHKKPRIAAGADDDIINLAAAKPPPPPLLLQPHHQIQMSPPGEGEGEADVTTTLSLNNNNTKQNTKRVHECSICGAEFASGQALGGHMRRHRPLNAPPPPIAAVKEQASINLQDLDLNLPAPSDESPPLVLGLAQFTDANKAARLVLTASPLVDCHY